jgi:uncharacterized protein YndB with AHSA1/START domain
MTLNAEVKAGDRELTIACVFDAPRARVQRMERARAPETMVHPKNFTIPVCETDFRDGGKFRFCMRGLANDHWVNGVYREIVMPERIVWTGTMEHGGNTIFTTVTFENLGDKTQLTVHQTYSIKTDSTRGARPGWTATLKHLAEFLAAFGDHKANP